MGIACGMSGLRVARRLGDAIYTYLFLRLDYYVIDSNEFQQHNNVALRCTFQTQTKDQINVP